MKASSRGQTYAGNVYTMSHVQQHTCHSLCVTVVVMSRWCLYVRWCEMTAAFEFFKCRGTGLGSQRPCARIGRFHKTPGSEGHHTHADTQVSAWEKLETQCQLCTKETTHWNPSRDELASSKQETQFPGAKTPSSRGVQNLQDADIPTAQPIPAVGAPTSMPSSGRAAVQRLRHKSRRTFLRCLQ